MVGFKDRHPLFLSLYFLSVLIFTMFLSHPIILAVALLGAFCFNASLFGIKSFLKSLLTFLPLAILIAITNPLFSHNGQTILFFINSNPITKEALLYGINLAVMLMAVIYWFKCFNIIFTSDKLLYMLGRFSYRLSLLLSSALRFIPLFKRQSDKIKEAQTVMGLYSSNNLTDKLRGSIRSYDALISWSLENAVETGSSMKARGFGSGKRTSFSIFKYKKEDIVLSIILCLIDALLCVLLSLNALSFSFYPTLSRFDFGFYEIIGLLLFAILCFLPFIIEIKEVIKWKYLQSKI